MLIIPAMPVTAVRKIFKPELHKDTVARAVGAVLRAQKQADAAVVVEHGGALVTITLIQDDGDDAKRLQGSKRLFV